MEKKWDLKAKDVSIDISVLAPVRNHMGLTHVKSTNHHEKIFFLSTISIRVMPASPELKWRDTWFHQIWCARKTFPHPTVGIKVKSLGLYNLIAKYHFTCSTSSLTLWCLEPTPPTTSPRTALYLFDISERGQSSKASGKKKKEKERKIISYLNFSSGSITAWGKSSGWFHFIPTTYFFINLPPCHCTCYTDL